MPMKLFGNALSPFAMRVILAARYKRIDLPIEAPPGTRTPEYLALNPIGKVPVLCDGELVLPESQVILAYLEDRFPSPTLYPGDAASRANVRLMCRLIDNYSVPSFGPFLANDAVGIATALQKIDASLGFIDHFRREGEFASGAAFSAADCAFIPFFHIFEQLGGAGFPAWELVRKRPRLEAYWARAKQTDLGAFATTAIDAAVAERMRGRAG
jgi:glutathione S-transferase